MNLTGTTHGDAANELTGFYMDQVLELQEAGHYFMAAIALGLALETAILAYLLVEFGDDNGRELKIPASVGLGELIEAANEIGVLEAPIDIPSHVGPDGDPTPPRHLAKDIVNQLRRFRNLIHPARALKEAYDPRSFTEAQLDEFKDMYQSVMHSLLYNL